MHEQYFIPLQKFVQMIKTGSKEDRLKLLIPLFFALAGGTKLLPESWQQVMALDMVYARLPWLSPLCGVAFVISLAWLFWIWWKVLPAPPQPASGGGLPDKLTAQPLIGARAFGISQGELFQRLERKLEIDQLINAYNDSNISLLVLRGPSGAGKTSLLRSGFAWKLGAESKQLVWAEMFAADPVQRVLKAVQAGWARVDTPPAGEPHKEPALPDLCLPTLYGTTRRVLVLDQFEQLSATDPAHAAIFAFIRHHAEAPPPHHLLLIVSFRREYIADWQDYMEEQLGAVPDAASASLSVFFFTKLQARKVLATLVAETGMHPDEALADAFLNEIARSKEDRCIAPVDLAICILSLVDYARRTGRQTMTKGDFLLDGGAAGMLANFLRSHVQDVVRSTAEETAAYQALWRLVDPAGNCRKAEGATIAALCKDIPDITPARLQSLFNRLEGPKGRLLEEVPILATAGADGESDAADDAADGGNAEASATADNTPRAAKLYRLSHDRLAEAVRRLAGTVLGDEIKAQTVFDNTYFGWREISKEVMLKGKDLALVERYFTRLQLGDDAEQKRIFFAVAGLLAPGHLPVMPCRRLSISESHGCWPQRY